MRSFFLASIEKGYMDESKFNPWFNDFKSQNPLTEYFTVFFKYYRLEPLLQEMIIKVIDTSSSR